jgi:hypothetical protein
MDDKRVSVGLKMDSKTGFRPRLNSVRALINSHPITMIKACCGPGAAAPAPALATPESQIRRSN